MQTNAKLRDELREVMAEAAAKVLRDLDDRFGPDERIQGRRDRRFLRELGISATDR